MTQEIRYPECEVALTEVEGNAMHIIGAVRRSLRLYFRETDVDNATAEAELNAFSTEAMSGNYDHLLQTCMRWVDVS